MVVGAVTLLAGVARFYRLAEPSRKIFDEVYYASDGCFFAGIDYRTCELDVASERSWVHPPLGKNMIALGIDAFGNTPFGWRFAAAVAGTALVAMVGAIAYFLLGSVLWAGVAAALAATEHLEFVQSRIAMLDVFLAFFVVLGFLFLVADRVRNDPTALDEEEARPRPRAVWRPLRLLAGVSFGAAVAVKWSGLLALAGALVLSVSWARSARKRAGDRRPLIAAIRTEGFGIYLALVILPFLAYVSAWIPWLADHGFNPFPLLRHHGDMAEYHVNLDPVNTEGEPVHPYLSPAWKWLPMVRAVAYFWDGAPDCCRHILAMGHPLLFWGSLIVIPYLAYRWTRDWRAGAIVVPIVAQFLPWLAVGRPLFLFYMTPVTPFLALGMAYALRDGSRLRLGRWRVGAATVALIVLAFVGLFAFFWPVLTASHLSVEAWEARMWLQGWI